MADWYLTLLIAIPLVMAGAIALLPVKDAESKLPHQVALGGSLLLMVFSLLGWSGLPGKPLLAFNDLVVPWIPSLGLSYAVGADGISMTLVVLTTFLCVMAVIASFSNITKRLKLYYSMLFVLIASVLGVFLARDTFLFFLFWELELIPMFLLIAIWGGPNRRYAAVKFVLYTLFGSAFMVASILGLYFIVLYGSGVDPSTVFLFSSIEQLTASGQLPLALQILLFLGFFIGFAIKLPVVPVHTWLPDAHVEAPTPVSMLLAGILLKMGAYGMLRFGVQFFPDATEALAPYLALLAVINVVYTAGIALVQKDLKKLIAYSSVSHMGFVLLGLASLNATGIDGAMFVMVSHGIVSAALFMCVGTVYLRSHTRMIADLQGLATQIPVIYYFFLFMAMASLGLPLLISFAGESLVMYGAYLSKAFDSIALGVTTLPWSIQTVTVLSAIGVVLGAAYLLWMVQRVFGGVISEQWKTLTDATPSEVIVLASLSLMVLVYGLFPNTLLKTFQKETTQIAKAFAITNTAGSYVTKKPVTKPAQLTSASVHP